MCVSAGVLKEELFIVALYVISGAIVELLTPNGRGYFGSVDDMEVNGEYAAALVDGYLNVHLVEPDPEGLPERESIVFPEKRSVWRTGCGVVHTRTDNVQTMHRQCTALRAGVCIQTFICVCVLRMNPQVWWGCRGQCNGIHVDE